MAGIIWMVCMLWLCSHNRLCYSLFNCVLLTDNWLDSESTQQSYQIWLIRFTISASQNTAQEMFRAPSNCVTQWYLDFSLSWKLLCSFGKWRLTIQLLSFLRKRPNRWKYHEGFPETPSFKQQDPTFQFEFFTIPSATLHQGHCGKLNRNKPWGAVYNVKSPW